MSPGAEVLEGELRSGDGLRLHLRERRVRGAMARILLVHGVAEHGGRYESFEEFFARRGVGVSVLDLRGHGRSEGRRVWVPSFESYLQDLDLFLAHVLSHGQEVFLVGHSLGGLIALRYAETRHPPVGGLIVSGAALRPAITPPRLVTWLLRQVNSVWSATPVPGLVKARELCREPSVVRAYEDDPLVPGHITTGLGLATLEAGRRALAEADSIRIPTLVLHGGGDTVVDPKGSVELLARLGVADRELKLYPGLSHEIFNEPERETVLGDVFHWVKARTHPGGAAAGHEGGAIRATTPIE